MQFAKAGDDCEPKSLKAREDGALEDLGSDEVMLPGDFDISLW